MVSPLYCIKSIKKFSSVVGIFCSTPGRSFVHFFLHYSGAGGKPKRRRKRCRNCTKLLKDQDEEEFCDESCQELFIERSKKDDFVSKCQFST